MTIYTGGCFCGALTFKLAGPIPPANRCHCSLCRKRFGGAGSAMSRVDHEDFEWTCDQANLTRYGKDWGLGFCAICGSTLVGYKDGVVIGITLSSLDGDPPVEVEHHLFVGSKASWDHIGGDAPQYEEWPTAEPS